MAVDMSEAYLDFTVTEDMDPSLQDGYQVIYDREVPIEVRQSNETSPSIITTGVMESIKVKVLIQGLTESPTSIRVELSSEADLFFYYAHVLNEESYQQIKNAQNLCVDFDNYANILIRMLNSCIREPVYLAIYTLQGMIIRLLSLMCVEDLVH